jgi:hypothetical protein
MRYFFALLMGMCQQSQHLLLSSLPSSPVSAHILVCSYCVMLGKSLALSEPQIPHPATGFDSVPVGLNESMSTVIVNMHVSCPQCCQGVKYDRH